MTPYPSRSGRQVTVSVAGERVGAFMPPPLPPDPPVRMERLQRLLERAALAVGQLNGTLSAMSGMSPLLHMYARKEALLSSQIEGIESSLLELFLFETENAFQGPSDDVQEVSNHVSALAHGLDRIGGGFPLSLRLIREIHEVLMEGGRGRTKRPGEFRTSQNWIGGTRPGNAVFVPPPPEHVLDLMSGLEAFIHADTPDLPVLVKAGLVHVQFETIHPFLDGNGRLGRLLILLLLCEQGILQGPYLSLSLYFKAHRQRYYGLLQRVRGDGGWEAWLEFFLEGVAETASQAVGTARALRELFDSDRRRIEGLGRQAASVLRIHQLLQRQPIAGIPDAARKAGLSIPTAAKSVRRLEALGIVRETTGKRHGRRYLYQGCMDILDRGTEPL